MKHTNGPRLYLAGRRIHHGLVGAWMLSAGLAAVTLGVTLSIGWLTAVGAAVAQAGLVLALHDATGWPWPLLDRSRVVRTAIPDREHWLGELVDPRDTTRGDW